MNGLDTQNLRSLKSSVEKIIKNEEDDAAIAQAMQQQDILTSGEFSRNFRFAKIEKMEIQVLFDSFEFHTLLLL